MKLFGLTRAAAQKAFTKGQVTVSVFGLGKMGLPLSAVMADVGAKVIGVDVDAQRVHQVNDGRNPFPEEPQLSELIAGNVRQKRFSATTNASHAVEKADVHVILVPTTMQHQNAKNSPVFAAARVIAKSLHPGDVVITECTLPPGTTDELAEVLEQSGLVCGRDFGVAHCPERTMSGTAIRDIRGQYPKIVGANDEKTRQAVAGMYAAFNQNQVVVLESVKEAECVKVFEGVYRFVNISLANELADVAERIGVDARRVFAAANTQPFSHIHAPGAGAGGHCIPEYPKFIASKQTRVIHAATQVNDGRPRHVVDLLESGWGAAGLKAKSVAVLGLTFRPNVLAFENTPAGPIIAELKKRGAHVSALDPLCRDAQYEKFGVPKMNRLADVDAVVIVNKDAAFLELDWAAFSGKAMVDAAGLLDRQKMEGYGIRYKAVGGGGP
ncbi:nucleotide sugar dehydrogenase [Candidatus Micrarchaeota archaeon]|nr:nucleotide sugar dehydrogenase [Candidatus Micrarchaeota archaeon]